MSTITIVNDFRGNITCVSQKVASPDFRRVLLPDVAQCKFPGLRYTALDQIAENSTEKDKGKSRCLAAARYLGQAYVLAEAWELP